MANIFTTIRQYEDSFLYFPVDIVDSYQFDQLETIKKIHKYYAGQYDEGTTEQNKDRYFVNITKYRVKNAAKNIDLDTKDVLMKTKPGGDPNKVWLLRRDTRRWLNENGVDKKMNKVRDTLPKYGTVIAKKVQTDDFFKIVDMRNIKNDPTAERIKDSWVIEDHYFTPSELKSQYGDIWDNVDEAVENFTTFRKENYVDRQNLQNNEVGDARYIHVREFFGDIPEDVFDPKKMGSGKYIKAHYIVILPEDKDGEGGTSQGKAEVEGLVLFKEEWKEGWGDLYKDVHYDNIEGRYLGVGLVEDGFDLQAIKNRQVNQLILAQDLANLTLFQTSDDTVLENVLSDLVNGDIIETENPITPINTQVRDLGSYQVLSGEVRETYNNLANSFEVTTGESLPSGTPFSLGALINRNANKHFDDVREQMGIFWKEIVEDWIMPRLTKDLNMEHILEITDERELMSVNKSVNEYRVSEAVKGVVMEEGRLPTPEEAQMLGTVLSQQVFDKEVGIKIPKGYYKEMLRDAMVVITDENANKNVETQEFQTLLQITAQNPQIIEHPLFKRILDWVGLSGYDLPDAQPMLPPQMAQPQQPQEQITQ